MHWYVDVLKNYVGFDGRAHRTEFWMFALIHFIVYVVLTVIENVIGLPGVLSGLYWLGTLLPALAVTARRLHDTDRTGLWILIGFIPFIGGIVLLIFCCLDSTPGDNQYGPNPKASLA